MVRQLRLLLIKRLSSSLAHLHCTRCSAGCHTYLRTPNLIYLTTKGFPLDELSGLMIEVLTITVKHAQTNFRSWICLAWRSEYLILVIFGHNVASRKLSFTANVRVVTCLSHNCHFRTVIASCHCHQHTAHLIQSPKKVNYSASAANSSWLFPTAGHQMNNGFALPEDNFRDNTARFAVLSHLICIKGS